MTTVLPSRRPRLLSLLLVLSSATGCITERTSHGELGRAEFAWDEGILGCLFGCNAKEAMANRAVAVLNVVNYDDLPAFDVASDNPSVIDFTLRGTTSIRCETHQQGSAKVLLYEAGTTTLVDRFEIRSRHIDRIEPNSDDLFDEHYLIEISGDQRLYFDVRDSRGRLLRGIGGVDYAFTGGLGPSEVTFVDAIADFLGSIFAGTNTEYIDFDALATGAGTLTVAAPSGASYSVPFSIVDATAITRIDVETSEDPTVGQSVSLQATAFAGTEQVHSPGCAWSLSPPTGVADIQSTSRDFVTIVGVAPGSVTVSCAAGTVTGALGVTVR